MKCKKIFLHRYWLDDAIGVSYYYFDSDPELLMRLKETTFTIAKEIMLNNITKSKLPKDSIIKLAGNSDYDRAMEIITIIESMRNVVKINKLDWIYSNVFTECLVCFNYEFSSLYHHFINWKLDDALNNMLKIANDYMDHSVRDFTSSGYHRDYAVKILDKITVSNLTYNQCTEWKIENYTECLKNFFEAYKEFKVLVQNMRIETDII